MNTGLGGRVALVTGGGSGIGRAIALALAAEGARVAVLGRTEASLEDTCGAIRACGGTALALVADVAESSTLDAALTTLDSALGAPEVLVHSAAAFSPRVRLGAVADAEWDRLHAVNVRGVAHLSGRALEAMRRRRWGRVVLVSSLLAEGGGRGYAAYATTKAAQEALIRAIALDYGPFGVTANAVSPGFIATPRWEATTPEPLKQAHAEAAALKRLGTPEEVAAAVVFLASEAAAFVTGSVLPVGGGTQLNTRW